MKVNFKSKKPEINFDIDEKKQIGRPLKETEKSNIPKKILFTKTEIQELDDIKNNNELYKAMPYSKFLHYLLNKGIQTELKGSN